MAKTSKKVTARKVGRASELQARCSELMQLSMPDKRKAILYARITEENKKFLDSYATGQGVSLSVLLDSIIENIKTSNDSTKTRLKKSN